MNARIPASPAAPAGVLPNPTTVEDTGAQLLVLSLRACGVRVIFGVPGDTGVELYDALASQGYPQHVLTNDERSAVFAADAYARRTNAVGVVEVSSGGGVTYAVGGLGEAFAASVPLLVIASDISRRSRGTGALTELNQVDLFRAVTKARFVAESADLIPELVRRAFVVARAGRPAPVVLIVPEDVLHEKGSARIEVPEAEPGPPLPDAALAMAAKALDRARIPAIVAGGGVFLSNALTELETLAQVAGCAVATTIHGKGAYAEGSPLSLGVVGANGGVPFSNAFLQEDADFVLFVGSRANATDTNGFTAPPRRRDIVVAQCDIDRQRAGRNFPGSIPLVGNARDILVSLATRVRNDPERRQRVIERVRSRRCSQKVEQGKAGTAAVDPRALVEAVHTAVGSEITVVADCGTPTPYLAAYWRITKPGRRLITPRGHGPMGYAIAGAVGAAHALPDEPILVFTTDGSLLMSAGILETVARLSLPIVIVQLTNRSLGWIRTLQELYFGGRQFSTALSAFDSSAVARGFGINAASAGDVETTVRLVQESIRARKPMLIDVQVPEEYALLPPVAPWLTTAAKSGERPMY